MLRKLQGARKPLRRCLEGYPVWHSILELEESKAQAVLPTHYSTTAMDAGNPSCLRRELFRVRKWMLEHVMCDS